MTTISGTADQPLPQDPYPITHPETTTDGISPKAVLAFLFPLIAAIVASITSWMVGGFGAFDTTSIVIAAAGVCSSGLALLGAWLGHPGSVTGVAFQSNDAQLAKAGVNINELPPAS